jgi:hypothetical protein
MFSFLGTLTREELSAFSAYAKRLEPWKGARLAQIRVELARIGWYDREGRVSPPGSQLDQLFRVFKARGGRLNQLPRSRGNWIYLIKGDFSLEVDTEYQGGRLSDASLSRGGTRYDDAATGLIVDKIKRPVTPWIRRDLENLEFEIKRAVDHTDVLILEAIRLVARQSGSSSLEALIQRLEVMSGQAGFTNITGS